MADYFVNENSLIEIANTIRSKTGTTGELQFPDGFIEEINNIGGTGSDTSEGVDTSDATATANDILSGKTAYVNGQKITGTIASQAAQTITPGTSNKTIAAGKYLSGVQTIKGDSNLISSNIKNGVSIFEVTGSYSGETSEVSLKQKIFSGTVDASGVVNMSVDSGQKIVSAYLNGATEALNILCVINVENECMAGAWTSSGASTTSSSAAILSSDGRYLTWIVDPGASTYVDTAVTGVIYYI